MSLISSKSFLPFRASAGGVAELTAPFWDNDLAALPDLEWDPDFANNTTEAYAETALSLDTGKLVVDTEAPVNAGAGADYHARWWLSDELGPSLGFFLQMGWLGAVTTGISAEVRVRCYHLADAGEAPSTPPNGNADHFEYTLFQNASSQNRYRTGLWDASPLESSMGSGIAREVAGALSAWEASSPISVGGTTTYAGINRSGSLADDRSTNGEFVDTARLRWALEIVRDPAGTDITVEIPSLKVDYSHPRS